MLGCFQELQQTDIMFAVIEADRPFTSGIASGATMVKTSCERTGVASCGTLFFSLPTFSAAESIPDIGAAA